MTVKQTMGVWLLAALLLSLSAPLRAIENLSLVAEQAEVAGAQINDASFDFALTRQGLQLTARAAKIQVADQTLEDIILTCPGFTMASGYWQCNDGQLQFLSAELGKQQVSLTFTANTEDQRYQLQMTDIAVADGSVAINVSFRNNAWQADIDAKQVQLTALEKLLSRFLPDRVISFKETWQPAAVFSLQAELTGQGNQPEKIVLQSDIDDLTFSDAAGEQVGEGLSVQLSVTAMQQQGHWKFSNQLTINDGQTYLSPVFTDFQQTSLDLQFSGDWQSALQQGRIKQFTLVQQGVLSASGQAAFADNQLTELQLDIAPSSVSALYEWWLKPFAAGTAVSNLESSGQISAELRWRPDATSITADLQAVSLADVEERYAVKNLEGKISWTDSAASMPIDISWQQIQVGKLPIEQSRLQAQIAESRLELVKPIDLPIFDGGLQLSMLQLAYDDAQLTWQFEGLVRPVSLRPVMQALDWPLLEGKISGVIPQVRYQNDKIAVGGALLIKIFDGSTVIKDLQLQSPFGSLPQLTANIDMQTLDLDLITQAFDVGKISGRIDGHLHGLRLSDWQPVAFDGEFATSKDDPGKRRISQRAVNNLSQLGGGASGVLSRSFLRFFEDFSYDQIGISCQLQNEICLMGGVKEAEQGYYIVEGGGLPPWINVIGYNRRVDWPDFLARIQAVKNSDGPIIE